VYNEVGQPRLQIVEKPVSFDGRIEAPPYSVTLLRLPCVTN
jgi:hypothetical protein